MQNIKNVEQTDTTTITVTNTAGTLTIECPTINMANLPTSDPSVAGQLWNSSGTLTVSSG